MSESSQPTLYPILRWSVPVHALLPALIALAVAQGGELGEAVSMWSWVGIHVLFPVALVLSYPWWRGRGDQLAAVLIINHAVTFAVGVALISWW
ncbi:hypothetical protein G6O69_10730 [Pseudenhygromyxa sp. WMMC2535]|uniref:hypothetical protein n=1 Tax=Pseudenhygromyxa sp. WMMC2535 TaxID=2712867 RepID=UPI0015564E44|nr:hypothetical protein [Pseudenhygromyxa sp. WMMC2535]NVB38307.1 hypothetical protein [Pseudenhygromyxa sp. WMMC2535]